MISAQELLSWPGIATPLAWMEDLTLALALTLTITLIQTLTLTLTLTLTPTKLIP